MPRHQPRHSSAQRGRQHGRRGEEPEHPSASHQGALAHACQHFSCCYVPSRHRRQALCTPQRRSLAPASALKAKSCLQGSVETKSSSELEMTNRPASRKVAMLRHVLGRNTRHPHHPSTTSDSEGGRMRNGVGCVRGVSAWTECPAGVAARCSILPDVTYERLFRRAQRPSLAVGGDAPDHRATMGRSARTRTCWCLLAIALATGVDVAGGTYVRRVPAVAVRCPHHHEAGAWSPRARLPSPAAAPALGMRPRLPCPS